MTLIDLANKIPAEYRKEILELSIINNAIPSSADTNMSYLGVIWKNYIDASESLECGLCLDRILKNYKQLVPSLIELEKQSRLLKEA